MAKKYVVAIVLGAFLGVFAYTAILKTVPVEIQNAPDWRNLDVGLQEARDSDKLVLVDVYELSLIHI